MQTPDLRPTHEKVRGISRGIFLGRARVGWGGAGQLLLEEPLEGVNNVIAPLLLEIVQVTIINSLTQLLLETVRDQKIKEKMLLQWVGNQGQITNLKQR